MLEDADRVEALSVLSCFRQDLYDCLTTRGDSLFELTDALLVPAPVCATSPVTIAVNVVNPGVVNTRSFPSTANSDAGTTGLAGIGFPSPGAAATTPMLPTPKPAAGANSRPVTRPGGERC